MSVEAVLDASAVLAYLRDEPGADVVDVLIGRGAAMGAVNLAEVCAMLNHRGISDEAITSAIDELDVVIEPFLHEDAELSGRLRTPTRALGLGLGDRACLALAARLDVPAVTADRAWAELSIGVGVEVITRG